MRLDWAAILRAGVQGLGLKPSELWALTPAELMLMLGEGGPRPMDRGGLDALMARFPDADLKESEHGRDRRA